MQLIAVTGGIASGKSTIGRKFEELGAVRIDADQLARDAVAPKSPGLALVIERFGSGVLQDDGELNRAALGEIVFQDAGALEDLNAIVHPEVRRLAREGIIAAKRAHPDGIVVYEIPLLVESGIRNPDGEHAWDTVIVADAPVETRLQRMMQLRGMTESDARLRISHQATDAARREIADIIIDTSGTEEHTLQQVQDAWERIVQRR